MCFYSNPDFNWDDSSRNKDFVVIMQVRSHNLQNCKNLERVPSTSIRILAHWSSKPVSIFNHERQKWSVWEYTPDGAHMTTTHHNHSHCHPPLSPTYHTPPPPLDKDNLSPITAGPMDPFFILSWCKWWCRHLFPGPNPKRMDFFGWADGVWKGDFLSDTLVIA